jgi:hypothetical protein
MSALTVALDAPGTQEPSLEGQEHQGIKRARCSQCAVGSESSNLRGEPVNQN